MLTDTPKLIAADVTSLHVGTLSYRRSKFYKSHILLVCTNFCGFVFATTGKIGHCSPILDTLIPTRYQDGVNFAASNYSDMALWWKHNSNLGSGLGFGSTNPNLDCLMFLESIKKREGSFVGNFIPETSIGEQEGRPVIGNSILRASNALSTAVEICAFAKLLQWVNNKQTETPPKIENFFATGAPGCDHFLPDLFSSTGCKCEGTCDPRIDPSERRPSNHLASFDADFENWVRPRKSKEKIITGTGLMGCQKACQDFPSCEFFTYSHERKQNNDPGIQFRFPFYSRKHVCHLWKSCDTLQMHSKDRRPSGKQASHWSGPKKCDRRSTCPLELDVDDPVYPCVPVYLCFSIPVYQCVPPDPSLPVCKSEFSAENSLNNGCVPCVSKVRIALVSNACSILILQRPSPWGPVRKKEKNPSDQKMKRAKKRRKENRQKQRDRKIKRKLNNKSRAYGQSTSQIASTNVNR